MPSSSAKPRSRGPLFWIAISIGALLAIILVLLATSFYVGKSILDQTGDGISRAEKILHGSPDLEILNKDTRTGWITYKSKKSGKRGRARIDPENKALEREELPDDPNGTSPNAPAKQ